MSMEALFLEGGFIDGERTLATAAADYVAGMAAKITVNGVDVAVTRNTTLGLFKNDKGVDGSTKSGEQVGDAPVAGTKKASILQGSILVKMTRGTLLAGTTSTPWKLTPSGGGGNWTVGDDLFVAADGRWDNAPQATELPLGSVVEAPTAGDDKTTMVAKFRL